MTSGWASPSGLGLLAFGLMTMLFGLYALPKPYGNGFLVDIGGITVMAYAVAGLLVLVGLGNFLQGHLYWGSAFLGYAGFWGTWGYAFHHAGFAITGVGAYGTAGFFFLWLMFTLTLLIGSIKHGWGSVLAFIFVFVGFILLTILYWQLGAAQTISSGERWVIGGELIATGLIWWYGGTANLANHSFGKKLLPV